MIKAFHVSYNSDTTEGRGPQVTAGYATTHGLAVTIATRCPKVMGVSDSSRIAEIDIFETLEELELSGQTRLVRSAIGKLTDKELAALCTHFKNK